MFTSLSEPQTLFFGKKMFCLERRVLVSPSHACYISGLPQTFFNDIPFCKMCVLVKKWFVGEYLSIFINVPTYRTVLRNVRYCVPTYCMEWRESLPLHSTRSYYLCQGSMNNMHNINLSAIIYYLRYIAYWLATDCLLIELDAHIFNHNGYGPGPKEHGAAGRDLGDPAPWALGLGLGPMSITAEHVYTRCLQYAINRQSIGNM